jgi:hypothetical protein
MAHTGGGEGSLAVRARMEYASPKRAAIGADAGSTRYAAYRDTTEFNSTGSAVTDAT